MKIKSLKMVALAAGLALTGASCTGSSSGEASAVDTSLDPLNPTTQVTAVEEEPTAATDRKQVDTREGEDVMRRYEAYWEAYDTASGPPFADPTYEPMLKLATENQQSADINFLNDLKKKNLTVHLPINAIDSHTFNDVENAPVGQNILQFQDCHHTNSYNASPDEPQREDADDFTFIYLVEMLREDSDSDWHVSGVQYVKTVEGKSPCVKQ